MTDYYNEDLSVFLDNELKQISLNKRGQPRRRKEKQPRIYFTADTEDAIIEYLSSTDQNQRNLIYRERIEYAFYKLAENIIHTFKFYYTDSSSIEDLKHEVIAFLLEKLHLFNHSKNINDKLTKIITKEFGKKYEKDSFLKYTNNSITVTQSQINEFISTLKGLPSECYDKISKITPPKAYSYFGTIAKRYLILYNNNNYKKLQEHATIEDIDEDKNTILETIREAEDKSDTDKFIDQFVMYVDNNMKNIFPKPQDAKTADAIIELFRKRESLEIFNKKALYIYIREMTEANTPQITRVTKKLDTIRKKLFNDYYNHGYIKV